MKLRNRFMLNAALLHVRAFDNNAWKKDADGKLITDANGNPIFINAAGAELIVNGDTIVTLGAEARQNRVAKETAEAALAKYKGEDGKPIDPETAVKAMNTVKNIDAKKLIDSGEVETVKKQIRDELTGQLTESQRALEAANGTINNMRIDGIFAQSEFVRDNIAVPADMFQSTFRNNFKIEDNKVVAYDRNGNRLMSKKNAGDYADPNEALELLVQMHPQKDAILKANPGGGSGNNGGGGNRTNNGKTVKRADFDAAGPMQQAQYAQAAGKGELTIVD